MVSQQSRSQALVKEEGCVRRGEPTLNLAILIEMKPKNTRRDQVRNDNICDRLGVAPIEEKLVQTPVKMV